MLGRQQLLIDTAEDDKTSPRKNHWQTVREQVEQEAKALRLRMTVATKIVTWRTQYHRWPASNDG